MTAHPPSKRSSAALGLAALASFGFALTVDPGQLLSDDGGITLRYARRLAEGAGLSYSGAERVNGASSPLWTLWLAGGLRAGIDAATWVLFSGALFWSAAGLLIGLIVRRVGGTVLGLLAMLWFHTRFALYLACFTGLESGLTMTLAGLALLGVVRRSTRTSAAGLGAIVAGKLDGALLPIAFAGSVLARERRFPWRIALGALAFAAPVFGLLTWWFGSPIPHSATTKVSLHAMPGGFDRLWMLKVLWTNDPVSLASALVLAVVVGSSRRRSLLELTVLGWFALHLALYAAVDLGAPFPWYSVAPGFAAALCVPLTAARGLAALPRLARAGPVVAAALFVAIVARAAPQFRHLVQPIPVDGGLTPKDVEDLARLMAGAWIEERAGPGETLVSMFGLAAYAYSGPVYDVSELNSERAPERLLTSSYFLTNEVMQPEGGLPHLVRLASFRTAATGIRYDLFASRESRAAQDGCAFDLLPLAPEPCPGFETATLDNGHTVRIPPGGCFRQTLPNADYLLRTRGGSDLAAEQGPAGQPPRIHVVHEGSEDLVLEDVRLLRGVPVAAEDLPLRYRRWTERVGYLAEVGYP